jgi:DNA-binding MarR family transcriptional regulator
MMYEMSGITHAKGSATTALRNLPYHHMPTTDSAPASTTTPNPPAADPIPPPVIADVVAPDPPPANPGPAVPSEEPFTGKESAPPAGFWLHQAALTWRAQLDVRLRPLGLTPTQFLLLSSADRLERRAGPATQQEVAEQAGADRMMTSKVLRLLEKRGLLSRTAHESDARSVRVALSPDGRVLAERAAAIAREFDDAFFGAGAEVLCQKLQAVAEMRGR